MSTREIQRGDWPAFFDGFSRQHLGWLSTIEVLDSQGAQVQVREQPLAGITAEPKSARGSTPVSILIGTAPDTHIAHTIPDAAHVRVEEMESGAIEMLEIEAVGGATTRLRFRSTVAPELVDGVFSV